MLLSIGIFFFQVVIDLRAAYHQAKVIGIPWRKIHNWLSHLNYVKYIVLQNHLPLTGADNDCWVVFVKVQV